MPPTQKKLAEPVKPVEPTKEPFIKKGDLVNLVSGGRTLPNYEVLDWDAEFYKFRGSIHVAPQTEIVLIPRCQIEAMGLVNER